MKSCFIPGKVSISTLNFSATVFHIKREATRISGYVRIPALNPHAAIFYPLFYRTDKNVQCYSVINTVFKDRSNGSTTPDVCVNCFNTSSYTLNPNALDFSQKMDRSFTLNTNAPDVTILDSQGPADWDTVSSNSVNQSNEQNPHYILIQLRLSIINKVIIGHLNFNSLRNKFEMLIDGYC